ncbi:phage/plasmid replication protein, II/X family [Acidithiobacillus sulfuriphilus]|uniref:phage/plasmid replication protein, II/X family n=1 Tax=Acidithiobacillus sulfuriphilus TaxID=1867749 RepID=UPI003F61B466
MIDTLALRIDGTRFDPQDLAWMMHAQHKITASNWAGDVVDWSILAGVKMPSWFDGFILRVGSTVMLEGSPKLYQGHNVTGPDDLLRAASSLVDHVFGRVLRLKSYPPAGDWLVRRIDVTYQMDFGTPEALDVWMDTAAGVQRGIRRATVDVSDPLAIDGYGAARTLYRGKRSRYRTGKVYVKGSDLLVHPPRAIRGDSEGVRALADEFRSVARFESVNRALWLSDHAVSLGLLSDRFADFGPGVFHENARYFFDQEGIPGLVNFGKEPIVYFPVSYLHKKLNLSHLWQSEFSHYFQRDAAMNDLTLLKTLYDIAPSPKTAQAAFDFLCRVRVAGFVQARSVTSRSQFYVIRRLLAAAGVSDAMMQDGQALSLVRLEPCKVYQFVPRRDRLDLVQRAHALALDADIDRLHREVLPPRVA